MQNTAGHIVSKAAGRAGALDSLRTLPGNGLLLSLLLI